MMILTTAVRQVGRKGYYERMWRVAYLAEYPRERGEARRPSAGFSLITEGGRRPAPYGVRPPPPRLSASSSSSSSSSSWQQQQQQQQQQH